MKTERVEWEVQKRVNHKHPWHSGFKGFDTIVSGGHESALKLQRSIRRAGFETRLIKRTIIEEVVE